MGTETVAVNLSDSTLWAPYKDLLNIVNAAVVRKDADAIPDLEIALKKHKPDFISLLKNPVRSPTHRDAIKKASKEGIAIAGQTGFQILPQSMVDEALIISDMFDLNELTSLELLIAGQQQQPHFPGLTRGLVAMLLYYDGRRSLVSALRIIVQTREGRTWTMGLNSELTTILTKFTDQLKEEGLIMKVIDLIESIDLTKELDLLHRNRALGGPRYRKQVMDLISEIKQSLAEIILCWACQSSLTREEALRLMNHLAKQSDIRANGSLDDVTLTLVIAFLYVIDVGLLQTCEDSDPMVQRLNLVCESDLSTSIHKELVILDTTWRIPGLKTALQFAWGVTLRTLSQFPMLSVAVILLFPCSLQPNSTVLVSQMFVWNSPIHAYITLGSFSTVSWLIVGESLITTQTAGVNLAENMEEDEKTIDLAIEAEAFQTLKKLLIQSSLFHQEEFFVKRIHNLITDFIVLMPLKIKELRNRGDETARIIAAHMQEGLEPPANLPRHFEHLMNLIYDLYSQNPLGLDLALDYWCPADSLLEQTFSQRPSQRQVALYKFLRLAGDLLPAPLFVPYIRMLSSLSGSKICSHHCFSLLKMNGRNAGGQCSIVSWDHFFSSLHRYYNNLRQELAIPSDVQYSYRQRMPTKGITPQEVEGLESVLHLIAQVVKEDEVARVTLCENPQYVPIVVLLGLLTCSIAPELKASLLYTLAAFAFSPEIAFNIWQGLEAAQIIPTIKTTSVYHPSGILMELDEVETRNEEYPITRAMLSLIDALLCHPLPLTLGAGQRQQGLDPYIEFVRDSVLLRCNARAYKDEGEKWKIIGLSLKILEKVLRSYHIKSDDFSGRNLNISVGSNFQSAAHPGYSILAHMLKDSGLLRMILYILDEGTRVMDQYSGITGQSDLEESALLGLKLLHETLVRQDIFLELVRDTGCGLLVTALENLLMSINPRSGQADHLFVIAKYITYNTAIPEHSLYTIRILCSLCTSSHIAQHLVGVFTVDQKESEILLNGFVECLEVDVAGEDDAENDFDQAMICTRNKARQQLLLLLLNCLKLPGPNLSHFLLGFNLRKPIGETVIQEPGIMGSSRTCLHAILSLLDSGTESNLYPVNVYNSPRAAELAYQLIYTLCTNKDTSGPTLRYLRSTHDFLYRHLQFLPFKPKGGNTIKILSQQSWLLRTLAIELRVTSAHHQRSHVQRLLSTLLDDKPSMDNSNMDTTIEPIPGVSKVLSFSFIKPITGPIRRRLMRILDSLEFKQSAPSIPLWEYFDGSEVERVLKECEIREADGPLLVNIEELHRRLTEETIALQNISGLGQRSLMIQEISSVLQYAVKYNEAREAVFAKRQSFEAWRQVAEVVFIACPLDILGSDKKHQMVLEISQELIRRVMSDDVLPELMSPASGVILTLMTTLHHSVIAGMPHPLPQPLSCANDISSVIEISAETNSIRLTHRSSLLVVLRAIVECLLKTGSGLQRVRANYYSAFLNLLCIVQKPHDLYAYQRPGVEYAILEEESENKKLRLEYMDTILSFGETIMEIVCRDACSGHDVTKMLSLAVLDVAASLDNQQQWLAFMESKGYLRHLLDSLIKDDEELQQVINRSSNSYRMLYVFESKMALLTRISGSVAGALALLRNGVMGKLAECKSLDLRPDVYRSEEMRRETENWVLPDLTRCYQQILISILKLVLSITMTLGFVHREATIQLLAFVAGHSELFINILRDRSVMDSLPGLEELSLVTAVLSRASLDGLSNPDSFLGDTVLIEHRGQLLLLHHHLLTLLPSLIVPEAIGLLHKPVTVHGDPDIATQIKVAKLQIAANILGSCCLSLAHSGRDSSNFRVLFAPCLADVAAPEAYYIGGKESRSRSTSSSRPPELGLLVTLLHQSCSQLQCSVDDHKLLLQRLHSLPTLTSDELAEYLSTEIRTEQPTAHLQRELARQSLLQLLQYRVREVAILSYMIESSTYLLLRHLEYFLLVCKKHSTSLSQPQRSFTLLRRLQDTGTTSSQHCEREDASQSREPFMRQQDFENLKNDVQSVIGEPFFRKLHAIEQYLSKGRSHVSFLQAIIHRIKRLVRLQAK